MEIINLTAHQFFFYLDQVIKLEARQQIYNFEVVSIPHMSKSDKRRLQDRYSKLLGRETESDKNEIDSAWKRLRAMKGRLRLKRIK